MKKEKLTANILFSGIGCQERGFQNSNLFDLDVLTTSDICKESVLSYAAIHCGLTNEMVENYPNYPSREEMAEHLKSINMGYNPEKDKKFDWDKLIKRKNNDLEKYWLATKLSKNVGDISRIKELPYADLLTYSAPCTDWSIAGKQKGGTYTCEDCGVSYNPYEITLNERYRCPVCGGNNIKSTRSGLLFEVERILTKMVNDNVAPKFLLCENVPALVSKKFKPAFNAWLSILDGLGYNTCWKLLNAKECGVPQNRSRLFAISIRKDIDAHTFTFPQPFDNGLRLIDVLEDNVDEKYYISDEKVEKFIENFNLDSNGTTTRNSEIASCIRASYYKNGSRNICKNIENGSGYEGVVEVSSNREHMVGNVYNPKHTGGSFAGCTFSTKGVSPTLTTMQGGNRQPHIITGIDKSINNTSVIDYANCITAREDRGGSLIGCKRVLQ